MKEVSVTYSIDKDDQPIVTVPLSNVDKQAILLLSDWNLLMELNVSPVWRFATGQVCEAGAAKISIARLICDAKPKEAVQYLDQDSCNLRRSNLAVGTGVGKSRERDKLNRDFDKIKRKVLVKPNYINPIHMQQII